MKISRTAQCLLGFSVCCLSTVAIAVDWKKYENSPDGFTMMVPATGTVVTQQLERGWTGIYSGDTVATLHGLSNLGANMPDAEIEKIAARAIGIPATEWMTIGQGGDTHGWKHYSAFKAKSGAKYVLGEYGVGSKGSYFFYLETTVSEYDAHGRDYDHWYDAIWVK